MPASIVKSLAQKTGKPAKEVERLWSKAKEAAKETGRREEIISDLCGIINTNEEFSF